MKILHKIHDSGTVNLAVILSGIFPFPIAMEEKKWYNIILYDTVNLRTLSGAERLCSAVMPYKFMK